MAHLDDSYAVFKRGSNTFYASSLLFPKSVRDDVATLYAFVRTADDFVDNLPQDAASFYQLKSAFDASWSGAPAGNHTVDGFVELAKRKRFDCSLVHDFLAAMEKDLTQRSYSNLVEVEDYIYGSASTVGVMMARLMDLPAEAEESAASLGKALQYVNFIRDITEDLELGRVYLPQDALRSHGLEQLSLEEAQRRPQDFCVFIEEQLGHYWLWRAQGVAGFPYIPRRLLVAIATAVRLYDYTARTIRAYPFVVFRRKVKPHKARIVAAALCSLLAPRLNVETA